MISLSDLSRAWKRWTTERCPARFRTAYDEDLRCELPRDHTRPHICVLRTELRRSYRYEWSTPAHGPRRTP